MKAWWKSKTIWFNVATAIVAAADYLPVTWAVPVALVGNTILRFVTDEAIALKLF